MLRELQAEHRPWDKVRFICRERGHDPELVWLALKIGRAARAQLTGLKDSSGVPLVFEIPAAATRVLMTIDQQLRGFDPLREDGLMRHDYQGEIASASLIGESIDSSILEGAATTAEVAREMILSRRQPRSLGERMVANNYEAMRFVRDNIDRPLSLELLIEVQRVLTRGTLPDDQSGRLRHASDRVAVVDQFGEVLHEPPEATALAGRLEILCAFANGLLDGATGFVHPVVRAILIHFMIGYEHPFCDGNGRTARAIFYWSLLRAGYRLFEYLPISSEISKTPAKYGAAFLNAEADDFDATYFVGYHLDLIERARLAMWDHVRHKREELADASDLFSDLPGLNARQHFVLLDAIRSPRSIYTIEGHQRAHSVAYATARADLLRLSELGLLRLTKRGNRFDFHPEPKSLARFMARSSRRSRRRG